MKFCPITFNPITDSETYSAEGLRLLSPRLKALSPLAYSAEEQRREAMAMASKLSIQGVQPKLSARLNVKAGRFEIVDRRGRYILKPQVEHYPFLPENEALTMLLAGLVGIAVPLHGLVRSRDGTFTYFIRRFDRKGLTGKIHVEDFAQLSGASRETKYRSSMEQVAEIIERYCTFPLIEKQKLLKRTLFSFLVGNEDMHLKNFSLIEEGTRVRLSPAYDLVNSTLAVAAPKEELALPVRARKNKLTRSDLVDYFGLERLALTKGTVSDVLSDLHLMLPTWVALIRQSFLPAALRDRYEAIVRERAQRLALIEEPARVL